jgi:hypothetical protein
MGLPRQLLCRVSDDGAPQAAHSDNQAATLMGQDIETTMQHVRWFEEDGFVAVKPEVTITRILG